MSDLQKCIIGALLFLSLSNSAREIIPDDDGPEQQEEVMPRIAPPEPPPPPAVSGVPAPPPNPKWAPSDFSNQPQALGWSPDIFKVPIPMEERVQFWKDIYTKFTSDQGILHDSRYINVVYETVDFSDITQRADFTDKQKEKARRKRVDDKKKEVALRLKHLNDVKDGNGLTGDDRRYWDMLSKVDEPKKFLEAARHGRLRFQL